MQWVKVPAFPRFIQFMHLGTQQKMTHRLVLATHMGDSGGIPSSWFPPGPTLMVAAIWGECISK